LGIELKWTIICLVYNILDIIRSVNNIKNQLSNSQIIWKEEKDDRCGYLLKYGEREKFIEGAMTDVDLWMELKDFFEL